MGLDYSGGCVNFRDAGEWVNLIAGCGVIPTGRILRGGKLDAIESSGQIGRPGTIINLRKGPDREDRRFGADYWHFPIPNTHEKYLTEDRVVRRWLNDIFACLARDVGRLPVLFHCTSGKDRTGVVVAALLTVLRVERRVVVQEYLLSDGVVHRASIERALDGIGAPDRYFRRVDLQTVRDTFLQ
jgi:protein-tyrosine phosphatase